MMHYNFSAVARRSTKTTKNTVVMPWELVVMQSRPRQSGRLPLSGSCSVQVCFRSVLPAAAVLHGAGGLPPRRRAHRLRGAALPAGHRGHGPVQGPAPAPVRLPAGRRLRVPLRPGWRVERPALPLRAQYVVTQCVCMPSGDRRALVRAIRAQFGLIRGVSVCAVCGRPTGRPTALVRDGEEVGSAADYPWHVTVYDVVLDMRQICGGSLITAKFFVSGSVLHFEQSGQRRGGTGKGIRGDGALVLQPRTASTTTPSPWPPRGTWRPSPRPRGAPG